MKCALLSQVATILTQNNSFVSPKKDFIAMHGITWLQHNTASTQLAAIKITETDPNIMVIRSSQREVMNSRNAITEKELNECDREKLALQ